MPEVPEHIAEALRGIRHGLHLRWNPRAKVMRAGEFDVYGNVRTGPLYEPRWELWDVDAEGAEYKVMTLQGPNGEFRPPGEWLVELVNLLNPARYGGDVGRMIRAVVDDPNRRVTEVAEKDFDDLIEQVAKWYVYAYAPKEPVLADLEG